MCLFEQIAQISSIFTNRHMLYLWATTNVFSKTKTNVGGVHFEHDNLNTQLNIIFAGLSF